MNRQHPSARGDRGVAAGVDLAGAAGLRVLERVPSGGLCDILQPVGAVDAGEFRRAPGIRRRSAAIISTRFCWC